ncbi:CAP domain-containing protein [Burkholderia contaminans]|uniref:CAP domain-containing protein n=1 Tax=Burkholderia contaminans TaxID=488447 RepID=UPI001F1481FB|nr:CAP domain-containing protein [Burkholderia contaminans]UMY33529.1 CAP domain-containing protein [Burkholderia contaminans]
MNGQGKKFSLTLISMLVAGALAACGGGGGDGGGSTGGNPSTGNGGNTGGTNPPANSSALPPQTSVPAATYPDQSATATLYAAINSYRQALGVGLLRQDVSLDAAASAHAKYEQTNLLSGALQALGHDEASTLPGYTGAWPLLRAQAAGAPKSQFVSEVVAANFGASGDAANALGCWSQLVNTVYHLVSVTANTESVGVGVATPLQASNPAYFCVMDLGTSTGLTRSPNPTSAVDLNASPSEGGQQVDANLVVTSPFDGESNVATRMTAESPNPASDLSQPGRPIMVRVNSAQSNKLTTSSFQLTDASGAVVATRLLLPASAVSGSVSGAVADPNNLLPAGTAFLIPTAPLQPNTRYTVTFAGARDGSARSKTWSFTTGAQ